MSYVVVVLGTHGRYNVVLVTGAVNEDRTAAGGNGGERKEGPWNENRKKGYMSKAMHGFSAKNKLMVVRV